MKFKLLLIVLFFTFQASAQHTYTVTICPHFKGQSMAVGAEDSTAPGWAGNPLQHIIDSAGYPYSELDYFTWTNAGVPVFARSFLRFLDLSNNSIIPATAVINSATLRLYGIPSSPQGNFGNSNYSGSPYNGYGQDSGWVYELADTINTHTMSWRKQPGVKHTDSALVPPSTMRWSENDTIDVTSLVQDMHAHVNTGFMMKLDIERPYRERMFADDMYTDSTLHPALVVNYTTVDVPNLNSKLNTVLIYPNPIHTDVHLNIIASLANKTNITIFDATGQSMYASEQSLKEGDNFINITTDQWPAGIYIVETYGEGYVERQRFTKL